MSYITPYIIYKKFINQKNLANDTNIKTPSNLNKLSSKNIDILQKLADKFNTIYQNIDIDIYLMLGFQEWKSFNLDKIDNKRLLDKYKGYDKKIKRNTEFIKKSDIQKSLSYINDCGGIEEYCNDNRVIRKPIYDYIKNKIDGVTLTFLVEKKYLKPLTDEERELVSYLIENYNDIKDMMYKNYEFILNTI